MTEHINTISRLPNELCPAFMEWCVRGGHVISQTGTVKTFTAEQVSALYHIAVDFWMRNEEASVDVELPVGVVKALGEVS